MAETTTDAEKAAAEANAAQVKADEKAAKAAQAEKSREQLAAERAAQEADDARARAAEAAETEGKTETGSATVATAGVLAPLPGDTDAASPRALKLGNDPANPNPLPDLPEVPDASRVHLTRTTPDVPGGPVEIFVHPNMVGDYLRAGWGRG
ncbi:hypothetical protein DK419_13130 [Methylobacterium terrae]|uniref:Uncharacterized protein n=1 Tax=Methylobacterium terrae TaxID=2202827 RepID=A0A2U8WLY1_9HYPH|nr:hypothetical protein [Methylobacterium terrae]AWN47139.1 hypothetical protein DK419_13130 [Methylobacterium terrae]